jgi:6-phosphofructokinase 1
MNYNSVSEIISRGGTILKTARCLEFMKESVVERAAGVLREKGLDALVVLGGDGSFRGALDLSRYGLPVIGIPCTIDNDIGCSDYTIGFDTALNTAVEAIDKIRDTCSSHDRCSVVEVMGRNAGYLAVNVAVATAAEAYIIPENEFELSDICEKIRENRNKGKSHFLVIMAEGVGGTDFLAKTIEKHTGIETRPSVLGYIQRGGSPSAKDRIIASKMGLKAIEVLLGGAYNRVIVYKDAKIIDYDIKEALDTTKEFAQDLARLADTLTY